MGKKGENIYKRKDGRWEARYIKWHTPEGTARYGYCYGKTYYEVKDKVNRVKAAILNNQPIPEPGRRKRFGAYCDEWLLLKRSRVRESTYVKYSMILEKHIKPRLGGYYVETMSEVLVEQFSYELLHERKLAVKTVRDMLSVLSSILNYAGKQEPSLRQIEVVYPKEKRREMRVLTRDEQERFVNFLLDDMDECRFGVLLALLTGLRIGELCALKWSDISLENRTICISQTMQRLKNTEETLESRTRISVSEPKSNMSIRIIPLNDYTAGLCRKWKAASPDAYILTGNEYHYMEPRVLQYRMERYAKNCGLEGVHFHTLRHSFATRCVEVGFDLKSLSEILGHSSPRITLERYVHSSLELKRENMEKLNKGY